MSIPSTTSLTTRLLAVALAACAVPARAQEIVPPGPAGRGAILIYGNFCGPGSRGPGGPPQEVAAASLAGQDPVHEIPNRLISEHG